MKTLVKDKTEQLCKIIGRIEKCERRPVHNRRARRNPKKDEEGKSYWPRHAAG